MFRTASALALLLASAPAFAADVNLSGAGATFPQELYKRWVGEYQKLNPTVKIDYKAIGSGGGVKGFTDKTIDFAGSDAPLSKKELSKIKSLNANFKNNVIQIPSCAGGVVPAYNLPGVEGEVRFTGGIIAEIYMGKITRWNDAKLTAINPGIKLPDLAITPAYRTDGSGTTYVFTNYLCTQSDAFKAAIGSGKQVEFKVGQGGKGNDGVTQVVQQTKGAIGYIEQGFADANKIPYGAIKNKAGKFVKASPKSVMAAGAGAAAQLEGSVLAADMWNQDGEGTYPIASFTYLIVYKDLENIHDEAQAKALVKFLDWATHDGQKYAEELDFAPLAPEVLAKTEAALKEINFHGDAIVK